MNKSRIQSLIDLMSTVPDEQFNINEWMTDCGTPSCVAGWATRLPSWQENGGLNSINRPMFNGYGEEYGFAEWAGISDIDAQIICGIGPHAGFYNLDTRVDIVTPAHVVKALTKYLETSDE